MTTLGEAATAEVNEMSSANDQLNSAVLCINDTLTLYLEIVNPYAIAYFNSQAVVQELTMKKCLRGKSNELV